MNSTAEFVPLAEGLGEIGVAEEDRSSQLLGLLVGHMRPDHLGYMIARLREAYEDVRGKHGAGFNENPALLDNLDELIEFLMDTGTANCGAAEMMNWIIRGNEDL